MKPMNNMGIQYNYSITVQQNFLLNGYIIRSQLRWLHYETSVNKMNCELMLTYDTPAL